MASKREQIELGEQQHLDGTNHAKVKFVGMAWETLDIPPLLDDVVLIVKGTVVAVGEEVMKDSTRKVAKIRVTSVVASDGAP